MSNVLLTCVDLTVDRSLPGEVYRQIADKIRSAMSRGDLKPGEQLPGVRETARLFGVSTTTAHKAYAQLSKEGLLYRRRPRGTFVSSSVRLAEARPRVQVASFLPLTALFSLFSDIVRALSQQLHVLGLDLTLKDDYDWSRAEFLDHVRRLDREGAAGLVLYPSGPCLDGADLDEVLGDLRAPVLLVNWGAPTGFHAVAVDETQGVALAVRHLYVLGHRRIGYVDFVPTRPSWHLDVRRKAFLETCRTLGVTVAQEDVYACRLADWGDTRLVHPAWRRELAGWLQRADRPTGLACFNDTMAVTAWAAADDAGLRVPEDLSLVGFDNEVFAESWRHPLTTIDPRCEEVGRIAAQRLAALIEGRTDRKAPQCTRVTPRLVIRESTAEPR